MYFLELTFTLLFYDFRILKRQIIAVVIKLSAAKLIFTGLLFDPSGLFVFCAYAPEAPEHCIGVGSERDPARDGSCHRRCHNCFR